MSSSVEAVDRAALGLAVHRQGAGTVAAQALESKAEAAEAPRTFVKEELLSRIASLLPAVRVVVATTVTADEVGTQLELALNFVPRQRGQAVLSRLMVEHRAQVVPMALVLRQQERTQAAAAVDSLVEGSVPQIHLVLAVRVIRQMQLQQSPIRRE